MKYRTCVMLIVTLVITLSAFSEPTWAAKNCEAACKPQVDRCLRKHPIRDGSNEYRICVQVETVCLRKCQAR